jgi:predicted flap endonuclease-1-like 5' DNA nuclease
MEAGMLKKILYFGLGLAGVIFEKLDKLAEAGEERLNHLKEAKAEQEFEITVVTEPEQTMEVLADGEKRKADDLTAINGIGPTFAKRLKEAGILTYNDLAALTSDQLREITKAADWQANPEEWILQAKAEA